MGILSVDIETYSSIDLKKCGLYKYVEAADFQVLLFGYSVDGGPVEVVDLAGGEALPEPIRAALFDSAVEKRAYNAAFEIACLSRHFGISPTEWLPQWHCTMVHGLACGYTAGLGATAAALGLPQDRQKNAQGGALIRTFCVPVKGRRILPHQQPERWQLFKEYCRQDVVTEMAVKAALERHPMPPEMQEEWVLDQIINGRGVAIDLQLAHSAIALDEAARARHLEEACEITRLDNPNSRDQLLAWLRRETGEEIADLRKGTVSSLLVGMEESRSRRMLELRQELSKTSVKKYQAMVSVAGGDGRARGLLQFYAANRTGRWGGRHIQPQNLPQTRLKALDAARTLVKRRSAAGLELAYGSVSGALSQLIRTALVAPAGRRLVSVDFSAIEARITAWLAGEGWRQEVFATHGRIYEASASQMFGVPLERIVKGNPEYELRAKGKVAELALGFGGTAGALIQMGALNSGLSEQDLPDIVRRWRAASPRIVDMWYSLEQAAVNTVETCRVNCTHRVQFSRDEDTLFVTLPSGRRLHYVRPFIGQNRFGGPAICFWGTGRNSKRWEARDLWYGTLTENVVQATARDCLMVALRRAEAAGYEVVFHVHDEIVVEVDAEKADSALAELCRLMGEPIEWAPGLRLDADGYVSEYFRKD